MLLFESPSCRLIQNPNMRPQAGFICRFQKIGTESSGGLVQSRSELRTLNNTRPPAANFVSASSHELVTRTCGLRDCGHGSLSTPGVASCISNSSGLPAGYTQKFQSFTK